ncbi:MAG: 4Fe-4S dicluster domain-containing protein [Candidatus Hodarchaeales archaeon]|jgi:ferredoxin
MKIEMFFMKRFGVPIFDRILRREKSLSSIKGAILADEYSPERFEIILESFNTEVQNYTLSPPKRAILSIISNMNHSLKSIKKNPSSPKKIIDKGTLTQLEEYAISLGVASIGYTKLPRQLIFKERAVIHDNAIVITLEMDKDLMELAPHKNTQKMIMETYDSLGIASNKLTKFLREKGFSAQAGHPLGGLVLYPPLAEKAGLGWHGAHGLLITPEHGPRVRLTAIYTNIENLPFFDEKNNPHRWIEDFCVRCNRCIRKCPSWAIYETNQPIKHESGLITHIDNNKCFPVFLEYWACSICVKECVFNRINYSILKKGYEKNNNLTHTEIDELLD